MLGSILNLLFIAALFTVTSRAKRRIERSARGDEPRGFLMAILASPMIATAGLVVYVRFIAQDLVVERLVHGFLLMSAWVTITLGIYSFIAEGEVRGRKRAALALESFAIIPPIFLLTPLPNFLSINDRPLPLAIAGAGALLLGARCIALMQSALRPRKAIRG